MLWSSSEKAVEWFVLKGPYVTDSKRKDIGFYYDGKHEIYYASYNVVLAEFDALFCHNGCVYFVEMTTTDVAKSMTKLRYEIIRKNNFLKHVFPQYKNNCIIVTTYEGKVEMPDLPELIVLKLDKRTYPEFENDKIDTGYMSPRYASNLIHIEELIDTPYDYYKHLISFQKEIRSFPKRLSFDQMIKNHHPHRGMLKRLFLGMVQSKEAKAVLDYLHIEAPENVKIDALYITLKTNHTYSYEPHLYIEGYNKQLFEVKLSRVESVKLVDKRRRTHKDIKKLKHSLNTYTIKTIDTLLQHFTQEIR
jgi:hypothetical protein